MTGPHPPTHIAFADETNYNDGRYPGIGLVTLAISDLNTIQSTLVDLLKESNVSEFGWKHLKGAKYRFAALKMIDFAIGQCRAGRMRIDVLTWDTQDSRHAVRLPDKIANLQTMYYHLFRNVLRMRWPSHVMWQLHPDEHTAMNWSDIESRLDYASLQIKIKQNGDIFKPLSFGIVLEREFNVAEVTEKSSVAEPLIQLADLFVGLASYSRTNFDKYKVWKDEHQVQQSLFPTGSSVKLTTSDKERCPVLDSLNTNCKTHKLGVSLATKRMLHTPNPANPINFWCYEPQHPDDKAPTRAAKSSCE